VSTTCYRCATPVPGNSRFCNSCGADLSGESPERTLELDADNDLQIKLQAELGTDFVIERELGRGGMAVVYLGRDSHLGRKVAIKVLPPELTFGSSGLVERFKREARTAATLDHPGIIPVYRVSTGGKLFWYVMKYLEGESLDRVLAREGQLEVDRAADIVAQVADALGYAHRKQVVHRDIKPANVVVDTDGRITVTDFGIAKALDANTLTASGSMIGTPYYMSPEQCGGKRITGASDQYSLAVMTYQMLGGHVPFEGESVVDIIKKHVMDPPPPLDVLRPGLPRRIVTVVERGLAKAPDARFAEVTDFARALAAAAKGLDLADAPPSRVSARMSRTALVSPVPGALRSAKGTWREHKVAVFGGAGLVVVAAVAGVVLWPPARPRPPEAAPPIAAPIVAPAAPPPSATVAPTVAESAGIAGDTAPPPAGRVVRQGRLVLTGVPAGAAVTRDGRRMRGARVELVPGRRHAVRVTLEGYEPWEQMIVARAGEEITRAVALVKLTTTPAPPPTGQAPPAPAVAVPAQPTVGYLSLGTQPRSTIHVNGTPAPRYPLVNFQVPAGRVRLRFQVVDSTGLWWGQDREVTVGPGDTVRLGFIRLVRQ